MKWINGHNEESEMWTVNNLIDEAVEKVHPPENEFRELKKNDAVKIFEKAKQKYVIGNPRVWWTGLKKKPLSKETDSNDLSHLDRELLNRESVFYFIPENETEFPRVFEVGLSALKAILEVCSFFEYNLVGPSINWLVIENDHSELLVIDE
jgi:hypothetical protein